MGGAGNDNHLLRESPNASTSLRGMGILPERDDSLGASAMADPDITPEQVISLEPQAQGNRAVSGANGLVSGLVETEIAWLGAGRKGDFVNESAVRKNQLAVVLPPANDLSEFELYEEPSIIEILGETEELDQSVYIARFSDGNKDTISHDDLIKWEGGPSALDEYMQALEEDDSDHVFGTRESTRITRQTRRGGKITHNSETFLSDSLSSSDLETDSEKGSRRQKSSRSRPRRTATRRPVNYLEQINVFSLSSDGEEASGSHRRKRSIRRGGSRQRQLPFHLESGRQRRSGRLHDARNMREIGEDEISHQTMANNVPKYVGAKEHFEQLPSDDKFRHRHSHFCDACNEFGDSVLRGPLVYCQGCAFSYHQGCLGPRTTREHLVTKIGDRNFVLQCKRCVNAARQKEPMAPNGARCFICGLSSAASHPLRDRKTTRDEHKEREENGGEDPITEASQDIINNWREVLFRCGECKRACHFHHLPPQDDRPTATGSDDEHTANDRFDEYCNTWTCKTCTDTQGTIETLVAWRPANMETYQPRLTYDDIEEDQKEYLVKWKKRSYFDVAWMPGAWTWMFAAPNTRKAFVKREKHLQPKFQTEDAVPEEYLRVDIVFDVEYTNVVNIHTIEIDQARIKEVKKSLVKFKGLGYEEALWVDPPKPIDKERWEDFKLAYEDWVLGRHVHPPAPSILNNRLSKLRGRDFANEVKLSEQPQTMIGGKLMDYQLEGLNWIYYQWFRKQNAILADEMGLGKTIQIIGFLVTLVEIHKCYPFLIVVPNSTCPNWRREIKAWAPSLRVVMYYGHAEARKMAQQHELFDGNSKDLSCHVVVTSYEAAQDDDFRRIFRGVHWAGLVVDEGQRLKNDKNLLFTALSALKIPFKILLTGTPLQNNTRELFNLLQFLDRSVDAKAMEEWYAELTQENVTEMHRILRPFMLRRTKAEVLNFLPPVAQIIVPVSLTSLQKKLYRSILSKNADLVRSVFGSTAVKQNERASLSNILMQLRKCLCHPFVYSRAIEQISNDPHTSQRNLVEASSKLRLLELMLPKLQERGHRVLIFSQFLDMLDVMEDFLDGLGLFYQRLDGSISALQKQKRIDEFNAPDSHLFAFLLSTRAGGVGINLATADTVIILDPDFNPHQDIQALSRAHRIGQKKKVLVFQLTTRGTAEEKIMQVGKKKLTLDHVLIERLAVEDEAGEDLESILRYGTDAIFGDDDPEDDIRYDSASVDKLLDRSQMEETLPGKDKTAESQFSFARVWANDRGILEEQEIGSSTDNEPDASVWDAILRERELEFTAEASAKAEALGRGRRKKQTIDYSLHVSEDPISTRKRKRKDTESDDDTDYQEAAAESSDELEMTEEEDEGLKPRAEGLNSRTEGPSPRKEAPSGPFVRANIPSLLSGSAATVLPSSSSTHLCSACGKYHVVGYCVLRKAGAEFCNLCGLAHYGHARVCPHLNSVTQLRTMIEAIKQSPEPKELKEMAKKRVVGIIGDISQRRRRKRELEARHAANPHLPKSNGGFDGTYEHGPVTDGGYRPTGYGVNGVAPLYNTSYTSPYYHPSNTASGHYPYSAPSMQPPSRERPRNDHRVA